jgi:hypothetical protein
VGKFAIEDGEIGCYEKTLVPNGIDQVTITDAELPTSLEFMTDGSARIYVTTDGSDPTIAGKHCYVLPAVRCVRMIPIPNAAKGNVVVKLLSEGAPEYDIANVSTLHTEA